MNKGEQAKQLFLNGSNCAQAVLGAFCKDFGLDEQTAQTLSACFGGGLGRQREVCGAVSGMCMALALKYAPKDPANHEQKAAFYARIQEICRRFKESAANFYRYLPAPAHPPRKNAPHLITNIALVRTE